MKKINLEEILQKHIDPHCFERKGCYEAVLNAIKESCEKVLELAAENAKLGNTENGTYNVLEVSKQSILDVINLIE